MSKDLSIFIDESGDFGEPTKHAPYYILSLVLHDQSLSIDEPVRSLKQSLMYLDFSSDHAIHSYPLIRNEKPYQGLDLDKRRKTFRRLMSFMRHTQIKIATFTFDKNNLFGNNLEQAINCAVKDFFVLYSDYFADYDNLIFYYDKGQKQIYKILTSIHDVLLTNDEVRIVQPKNYALFQVADMSCTLELLSKKIPYLTKSEFVFFENIRTLRKNYLKYFSKLKIFS